LLVLSYASAQRSAEEVFSEELVRCTRCAFAVARGVLHDFDAAEEAVQEAAYRAWRAAPRFDGTRPFRPWFLRIVRNTAVNELQRRARVAPLASEPRGVEPSPADVVVARERANDVLRAVRALPKDHRAALVLRGVHGLDYKAIAGVLAIPASTARIHVHRARRLRRAGVGRRSGRRHAEPQSVGDDDRLERLLEKDSGDRTGR